MICIQVFTVTEQFAGASLICIQGFCSSKYLLALRMNEKMSSSAFFSSPCSICRPAVEYSVFSCSRISTGSVDKGTFPSKYLWIKTSVRLTKFPNAPNNSPLCRWINSRQEKSASRFSGPLITKKYRRESG